MYKRHENEERFTKWGMLGKREGHSFWGNNGSNLLHSMPLIERRWEFFHGTKSIFNGINSSLPMSHGRLNRKERGIFPLSRTHDLVYVHAYMNKNAQLHSYS